MAIPYGPGGSPQRWSAPGGYDVRVLVEIEIVGAPEEARTRFTS